MDNENTEDKGDIVTNVKRYFDHDSAKQILKEKYESKMLFAAFDGMWKAGPELLSLLTATGSTTNLVILDEYGNPCMVDSIELYGMVVTRWQEQMNGWYQEFSELHNQR